MDSWVGLIVFWIISGVMRNALKQARNVPPPRRRQPGWPGLPQRPVVPPSAQPAVRPPAVQPAAVKPAARREPERSPKTATRPVAPAGAEGLSLEHGEPHGELHPLDRLAPPAVPAPADGEGSDWLPFGEREILAGIVWAEVLGAPRARRPYRLPGMAEPGQ